MPSRLWWRIGLAGGVVYAGYNVHRKSKQNLSSYREIISTWNRETERKIDNKISNVYNLIDKLVKRDKKHFLPTQESMKYPYQVPTLVMDLDGILGKSIYNPLRGWLFIQRDDVQRIMKELGQHYEIVIWSRQLHPYAQNLSIMEDVPTVGVLHQNHAKLVGSHWHRPLENLGRDLSTTLTLEQAILDHPEYYSSDPHVLPVPADDLKGAVQLLKKLALSHEQLQRSGGSLNFPDALQEELRKVKHDLTQFSEEYEMKKNANHMILDAIKWLGFGQSSSSSSVISNSSSSSSSSSGGSGSTKMFNI